MPITITLDDKLTAGLANSAKKQQLTVKQFALNVLSQAAEDPDELSLEELVRKIQATPPNPASIRRATGSLAEALQTGPEDPDFDEKAWNEQWAKVEAEMKAVDRANDVAEGLGAKMADYLLDTNHAATLVTLTHPLRHRVLARLQSGDTFAISVPVVVETLDGIGVLPRATQNLAEWSRLRPNFNCFVPDEGDAENAATLRRRLRQSGRQLATIDALIAVVAIRYDLILLTTDNDFAAVPGLKRENWFVL